MLARVQPVGVICGVLRHGLLPVCDRYNGPVHGADLDGKCRLRAVHEVFMAHVAVVRVVLGVEIPSVRENADVRAHGHHLFLSLGEQHPAHVRSHGQCVVPQHAVLDPCQRVLCQQPLDAGEISDHCAGRALRQQGIVVRCEILHLVEFAIGNAQVVVVAREGLRHQLFLRRRVQFGVTHYLSSIMFSGSIHCGFSGTASIGFTGRLMQKYRHSSAT